MHFVKVLPGLSARMRISMIALYCTRGLVYSSFPRYLRMTTAHSFAADGVDSAVSTIVGRYRTSSPYNNYEPQFLVLCRTWETHRSMRAAGFTEGALLVYQLWLL